jgi:hypothetical protein
MAQPTPDPPGKPAREDVAAVLCQGTVIFNALMPERFNKAQPAVEYLIPGKNEELRTYPRHCACAMSYIVAVGTALASEAPRTDPSMRNYRTGLLPWVRGGEARLREGVHGAGLGYPPAQLIGLAGCAPLARANRSFCARVSARSHRPCWCRGGWSRRGSWGRTRYSPIAPPLTIWHWSTENPWTVSSGGRPPSAIKWR